MADRRSRRPLGIEAARSGAAAGGAEPRVRRRGVYHAHASALDFAVGEARSDVKTGRETDGAPSIVDGTVYLTAGQDVIAYGP
jgi:hypothetical protein